MTKLITSDLFDANKKIRSSNSSSSELHELERLINNFINLTGSRLKGSGYDAVRNKMSLYADAISKEHKLKTNILADSINANNTFNNYAAGYDEIDNSKLEEIRTSLIRVGSCRTWLLGLGKDKFEEMFPNSSVGYDAYLASVNKDYQELNNYYEKIKSLDSEDASCHSLLTNVENDVNSYGNSVLNINPIEFSSNNYGKIDFSRMSLQSRLMLERLMIYWPNNMEEQRIKLIEEAIVLSEMGIQYSMQYRTSKDEDGNPVYMDCSSFISYLCNYAGFIQNRPSNYEEEVDYSEFPLNWTTNIFLSRSRDVNGEYLYEFSRISYDEIEPGDFALLYSYPIEGKTNHIVMYIGDDQDGNPMMIHCTNPGGVQIARMNPTNYQTFIRYNYGYGQEETPELDKEIPEAE